MLNVYEVLDGSHVTNNEPIEVAGKGEKVTSDRDLIALFGADKFRLIGPAVAEAVADAPSEPAPEEQKSESPSPVKAKGK